MIHILMQLIIATLPKTWLCSQRWRRVVIRRAVNGDRGSLPGGENGKRLMVTEQGGDQLLYSSHYPLSLPGSRMTTKILQMMMMMMVWQSKAVSSCSSS